MQTISVSWRRCALCLYLYPESFVARQMVLTIKMVVNAAIEAMAMRQRLTSLSSWEEAGEHEWVVTVVDFLVAVEITAVVRLSVSVDILIVVAVVCFSVTLPGSNVAGNVGVELPACEMCPVPLLLFIVGSCVYKVLSLSVGWWTVMFSVPAEYFCWVWFKSGVPRYSVVAETVKAGFISTVCNALEAFKVSRVVLLVFSASATPVVLCVSLRFIDVVLLSISLFILRYLDVTKLLKVSSKTRTGKHPSLLVTIAIIGFYRRKDLDLEFD